MQEHQEQTTPAEEEETGLVGLAVPAPSAEATDAVMVDPGAADRAARIKAIRDEADRLEAEQVASGKRLPEPPRLSVADQALREEKAQQEIRSSIKVSDNPQEVLPSWEEVVAKRQEDARLRRHQAEIKGREDNQRQKEEFKAKVVDVPKKEDIGFPIQEQLIVELYSK